MQCCTLRFKVSSYLNVLCKSLDSVMKLYVEHMANFWKVSIDLSTISILNIPLKSVYSLFLFGSLVMWLSTASRMQLKINYDIFHLNHVYLYKKTFDKWYHYDTIRHSVIVHLYSFDINQRLVHQIMCNYVPRKYGAL